MAASEPDLKRLWGLAAGTCSRAGCDTDRVPLLGAGDPTIIGEMAHVIAKKAGGARGVAGGGSDDYDNLVLLCPTCHTMVDKAPEGTFPPEMLHDWKATHEAMVRDRLAAPALHSRAELGAYVLRLLTENHATWREYGPDSATATANPMSSAQQVWAMRKITQVIPNNTRIVRAVEANAEFLSAAEYAIARTFVEHAAGFEASARSPIEHVPRFPAEFEEMMRRAATEE